MELFKYIKIQNKMKLFKLFSFLCLLISLYSCKNKAQSQVVSIFENRIKDSIKVDDNIEKNNQFYTNLTKNNLNSKSKVALSYCNNNKLNENFCFLIDMSVHSGLKRFFVFDFKADSVVKSGLVAHGCGEYNWGSDESKENPTFSNTPDSHLSSLGKYRVGKRGYSNWGIHVNYILNGLEHSNNNAKKRLIVMHGWDMVTDYETYPAGTVEGWGCPAVSNNFMTYIDSLLKKQNKPVLMWIYE